MKIITTITMFLACVAAHAQSVTYNHDASVMNQFLVGETGAGHLTPDLYYDALHKSYRNSAMMTSKQMFRLQMMQALSKEETHAEVIDSMLTDRSRVELKNIADRGPAATSMQKVKEYLIKQYAQVAITNDYWSYIIWHELDDDTDFDLDYCKMVEQMTAADVQRMAQKLLAAKRCIEVTMLSE